MIKKKILIFSIMTIMLSVPIKSYSYSLNNIQLATSNSDSSSSSSGGGETSPPSNEETVTPPVQSTPEGGSTQSPSNGTGGTGSSTNGQTTPPQNQVNSSVTMDGAIGEWDPGNGNLPNFNTGITGDEQFEVENAPREGQYFTISATVPLKMEFLIQNKDEQYGNSYYGRFITPYYKVVNNGSHTLNVHFESFEYGNNLSSSRNTEETSEKLYVVENPTRGNKKVEMRLNLTYDRPFNSYFKKIDLIPSNGTSTISRLLNLKSGTTTQILGKLNANEEARLYYGSDEWESPESEGINKIVESNFNLKLAFSIDRETTEVTPSEPGTEPGDSTEQQPGGDSSGSSTQQPSSGSQQQPNESTEQTPEN